MPCSFKHLLQLRSCLFIAFTAFLLHTSFAQQDDAIDKYVRQSMLEDHIPGAAVAVIKNGKIIKQAYYGLANVEDSVGVTTQSVFEIASMSKQFTCAAILLLQEEGKISIDDKASKYLDSLPAAWQNITVRQLMNHTSGLRDDWDDNNGYFLENYTDEKMFAAQKKIPLFFGPGEGWHYSSGPFDLGLIIKKITGKTYATFLEERIFKPLGMTSTSVYDETRIIPHRVAGYRWNDSLSKLERGFTISAAANARGDVGVITSLPDMIKWDAAIKTNVLLNETSRKQMFEAATLNDGSHVGYGLGWLINPQYGHSVIEHSGGFRTGFRSDIFRFTDIDLDIIILCNKWHGKLLAARIAALADSTIKLPSQMTMKKDPDTARTQKLKQWMNELLTNPAKDDSVMYRKAFLGPDIKDVQYSLKNYTGLTYIDETNNPMNICGFRIMKTVFYKLNGITGFFGYASFNYDDKGGLVCVVPENDF